MGLEHAQNAGGRVVREIAIGDSPYCTSDRQLAAYFALRGREPKISLDSATGRAMYTWDPWDEEIQTLLWEYTQPFMLQIEAGADVVLTLQDLKDHINRLNRRWRAVARRTQANTQEKASRNGDPAGARKDSSNS